MKSLRMYSPIWPNILPEDSISGNWLKSHTRLVGVTFNELAPLLIFRSRQIRKVSSAPSAVRLQEHVQCGLPILFVGFPESIIVVSEEAILFIPLYGNSFYHHTGLPFLVFACALLKTSNHVISARKGCERFSGAQIHLRLARAVDKGRGKVWFTV